MKRIFLTLVLAFVFVSFTKEKENTIENECNVQELITSNELIPHSVMLYDYMSFEANKDFACEWVDFALCGTPAPGKKLQLELCNGIFSGNTRLVDCSTP